MSCFSENKVVIVLFSFAAVVLTLLSCSTCGGPEHKRSALKNEKSAGLDESAEAIKARRHRAVSALIAALDDENCSVRQESTEALAKIHPDDARVIPAMIRLLKDDDSNVRKQAVEALEGYGSQAALAVPQLLETLGDEDRYVGRCASTALSKIGGKEIVPMLIARLSNENRFVREDTAIALSNLGSKASEAVPALIEALSAKPHIFVGPIFPTTFGAPTSPFGKPRPPLPFAGMTGEHKNYQANGFAADALGEIGEAAAPALLRILRESSDEKLCEFALQALRSVGAINDEVVHTVVAATGDERWKVRLAAVNALGGMGDAAEQVVPVLIKVLERSGDSLAEEAIKSLGKIGPGAVDAVPLLVKMLTDKDPMLQHRAAEALGEVGAQAETIVPALVAMLGSEFCKGLPCPAKAARLVLGKIGPIAMPTLIDALKSKKTERRFGAAIALGGFGAEAKDAVPMLIKMLKDKDYGVVMAATVALGRIGPDAREARDALLKLRGNHDDVRKYVICSDAAEALKRIGPVDGKFSPAFLKGFEDPMEALTHTNLDDDEKIDLLTRAVSWGDVGDAKLRKAAAIALGQMGPRAKSAIRGLNEAICNDRGSGSPEAAMALALMGPEGMRVALEALDDDYSYRRQAAADGLGLAGASAMDAVPALVKMLEQRHSPEAAEALGNILAEPKHDSLK